MTGRADRNTDIVVRRFRARGGHRLGSEPRHLFQALFLFNTVYSGRTGLPATRSPEFVLLCGCQQLKPSGLIQIKACGFPLQSLLAS